MLISREYITTFPCGTPLIKILDPQESFFHLLWNHGPFIAFLVWDLMGTNAKMVSVEVGLITVWTEDVVWDNRIDDSIDVFNKLLPLTLKLF